MTAFQRDTFNRFAHFAVTQKNNVHVVSIRDRKNSKKKAISGLTTDGVIPDSKFKIGRVLVIA
jgi:hypothetical protein